MNIIFLLRNIGNIGKVSVRPKFLNPLFAVAYDAN